MAKRSKAGKVNAVPKKRGRPKKVKAETVTAGSAMEVETRLVLASDDLGPIVLPSPEDSQKVLQELAVLQSQRYVAAKRHEDLKAKTKEAKEKVEALDEQISERIRNATHESDLPLFSQEQAEKDLSQIQEAASEPPRVEPSAAPDVPPLDLSDAAPMAETPS